MCKMSCVKLDIQECNNFIIAYQESFLSGLFYMTANAYFAHSAWAITTYAKPANTVQLALVYLYLDDSVDNKYLKGSKARYFEKGTAWEMTSGPESMFALGEGLIRQETLHIGKPQWDSRKKKLS